jgi:3,4-dihydroxy 2-butanone 4-phosphate synthase / GTP cyclohydrolase II
MFDTIPSALEDIKNGKMIIVVDGEDRENEGDFVASADLITSELINQMLTIGRGLICTPMSQQRARELDLPLMVPENNSPDYTAFTVSVDSIEVSTGVSAIDREMTIKKLVDRKATPLELTRPGHIFPLIAKDEGVLKRAGHTEATVDLMKLANLSPVGVICEVMNEDGTMSRRDDLLKLKEKHQFKIITIEDLQSFLLGRDNIVSNSTLTETASSAQI